MYTLIIVDDEILSRYALITLISKNLAHIQVVAECENGISALEKTKELNPDIIIMDIKMPGMNGLEASKRILQENPFISILIMTAYDSFDYISEALSIGVQGYILKPLIVNEVTSKLNLAIERIHSSNEFLEKNSKNSQLISTAIPVIEKDLVSLYITGGFDKKALEAKCKLLQIPSSIGYFLIIALSSISETKETMLPISSPLKESLRFTLSKRLKHSTFGIVGDYIFDILPIFIYTTDEKKTHNPLDSKTTADGLIQYIKEKYNLSSTIAIGSIYAIPELYKNSYFEAMSLLNHIPINTCELYHVAALRKNTFKYPYVMEDDLLKALRAKNLDKAELFSEKILRELFTHPCVLTILKEYVLQLLVSVKRLIYNLGMDTSFIDSISFLRQIDTISTNRELQDYLHRTLFSFLNLIKEQTVYKNYAFINKINAYIQNEAIGSLSLEGLASYLKMSPHYVSKLFKDEFQQNFVDYITDQKITYAKELLQKSNITIHDVSAQIGYNDQNYFCRIFKKNTGLTPKEYQKYENTTEF